MPSKYQLAIFPRGDLEVVMTRDFDAPRELVWDAWTKPELVKRWLYGPDGWSMTRCDIDLRVGGAYRFEMTRTEGGETMGWGGVYKELSKPERFVNTELFDESWYEGESLQVNTLEESGGVTTFTSTMHFVSKEARDAVLASGMDEGVTASYDRLDALFAELVGVAAAPVYPASRPISTTSLKE